MKVKLALFFSCLIIISLVNAAPKDADEVLNVWPGEPPGKLESAKKIRHEAQIYVYKPKIKANRVSLVIFPGGGYGGLATHSEALPLKDYLNKLGITVFITEYRVRPYQYPAAFNDAQRAVKLIRSKAKDYNIDANKIGVCGFSAGGHLVSSLCTHFDDKKYQHKDSIDEVNARPDYSVLIYPVISMQDNLTHRGSRHNLLGKNAQPEMINYLSSELQVSAKTPPTFIAHGKPDRVVKYQNSEAYKKALDKFQIPSELHILEGGQHGPAAKNGEIYIRQTEQPWSPLFIAWLKKIKML